MTNSAPQEARETHDKISQRAAAFLEQRRFGAWNEADQAGLDSWLAESFLHRAAYIRLAAAVTHAEQLVALCPHEFGRSPPDVGNAPGAKGAWRRFTFPLLAAASVALIAVFGFPYLTALLQPSDRTDSTDVGGRTLLSFADHTQIELNTDTAMRFRMTTTERTVWLEKGEAWFRVAHDVAHPFTVIVGRHRVTDLGTEFVVRRDGADVDVALLKGRAALSAEGVQTATLVPGDEAVATPVALSVTRKTEQELSDKFAWRRGLLVFHNARLADVVREFNRYNTVRLVVADPSISDVKVTATVKTDDYQSFLQLVEVAMGLRADRDGNDILISRNKRAAGGSGIAKGRGKRFATEATRQ